MEHDTALAVGLKKLETSKGRPSIPYMNLGVNDRTQELNIYLLSFALRCLFGLAAWWITIYTHISLFEDARIYYELGTQVANEWLGRGSSETLALMMTAGRDAWGMILLVAIFSFLLGGLRSAPAIIILYSLITAWGPVVTYKIARRLGIFPSAAFLGSLLVVLSPAFAFWGGALYKDGLILLLLNLIVYYVLVLQKSVCVRSIFILSALILALVPIRFYLPFLLLPSVGLGLLLGRMKKKPEQKFLSMIPVLVRQGLIVLVLVGLLVFSGIHKLVAHYLPEDVDGFIGLVYGTRVDSNTLAASVYLKDVEVNTPLAALKLMPIGFVYFMTVPFPWELGSLRQNLTIPEMVFWLFQYPIILLGMRRGLNRNFRGSILLITTMVVMSCFYAVLINNAGTAYRMRSQIWLFMAIFWGWSKEKQEIKKAMQHYILKPSLAH